MNFEKPRVYADVNLTMKPQYYEYENMELAWG